MKTSRPRRPRVLCDAVDTCDLSDPSFEDNRMSLYVTSLSQSDVDIDFTAHHSRPVDVEVNERCSLHLKSCPALN